MQVNEMRKDYILDRWVVVASQRKRRPTNFVESKEMRKPTTCPFCPGNEQMTPPAVLVYLQEDKKIIKDKDRNGFRHKDWIVRCVSNLYPAFTPPQNGGGTSSKSEQPDSLEAVGHHEVLIESPRHDEHPGVARVSQIVHVVDAYQDRLRALSSKDYVRYVSIFRNHGTDAGASLSHAHTQIIATPVMPCIVKEEMEESKSFWKENRRCIFCDIIRNEKESPRLIWQNNGFVAFAPWASVHPFEFWIFPKQHQSTLLDITPSEIKELAVTLRVCFGGLNALLKDPSYNFGFHMIPAEHYHWHIEVYPRLTIWAGFEKSTGMFINVVPPEEASSSLKESFQNEQEKIS